MYSQINTLSSKVRSRYTHTNLVARDWRKLATFYETVFGCTPVPLPRDLQGEGLQRGSGVPGAGTITWTYARDPEENIVELQSWSFSSAGYNN